MPELPEVEIARRNLERWWLGRRIEAVEALDPEFTRHGEAAQMEGRLVQGVRRLGKFLLLDLEGPLVAVLHLRMTGKVIPEARTQGRTSRARIWWRVGGQRYAFWDARRLGHMDLVEPGQVASLGVLGRLGPEPWPEALSGEALRQRLGDTRRAIKVAIMDQEVVAGVGNIVAAESLWRARIHPLEPASALPLEALEALGRAICEVCAEVVELESGEEVQYINDAGSQAAQNPFMVYRASRCPRCQGEVARIKQAGRGSWLCPVCQPRRREG